MNLVGFTIEVLGPAVESPPWGGVSSSVGMYASVGSSVGMMKPPERAVKVENRRMILADILVDLLPKSRCLDMTSK